MNNNTVSQPFQISEDDIERSSTLDAVDIGAWCVMLNGTFQFVESEFEGNKLVTLLNSLN